MDVLKINDDDDDDDDDEPCGPSRNGYSIREGDTNDFFN